MRVGRARRQLAALALILVLPGLLSSGCGERTPRQPSSKRAAYDGPAKPPEKLDVDGTTIVVGDPEAPVTVHLYEDPRCPVCHPVPPTDEVSAGARAFLRGILSIVDQQGYSLAGSAPGRLTIRSSTSIDFQSRRLIRTFTDSPSARRTSTK